jgi:hypothetical protein
VPDACARRVPKTVAGYHVRIAAKTTSAAPSAFFLPGTARRAQEREYLRLQACAERATGFVPADTRIRGLACRISGRDCTIEVGEPDPVAGAQVVAILDLGRHLPYGVYPPADREAPALHVGKRVYSVTAFA